MRTGEDHGKLQRYSMKKFKIKTETNVSSRVFSKKKAQELKSKILLSAKQSQTETNVSSSVFSRKNAQEEMIGFALIMIIVAVILMIFLGFALSNKESAVEEKDFQITSFLESSLQYTTECKDNYEYVSVRDLVKLCKSNQICANGKDPCVVLNSTMSGLLSEAWKPGADRPVKGYYMNITDNRDGSLIKTITVGNITKTHNADASEFKSFRVYLRVYY